MDIEGPGDLRGNGPGQCGDTETPASTLSGFGGALMIRMTRDPARIEGEKTVSPDSRRETDNLFNQDIQIDVRHTAIGVVQKQCSGDSQDFGRGAELVSTNRSKLALSAMQCGSLAAGEAEHRSRDSFTRQGIDDGAQTKGLVVGMGTHGNQ